MIPKESTRWTEIETLQDAWSGCIIPLTHPMRYYEPKTDELYYNSKFLSV